MAGRADPPRSGRATPVRRVVGAVAWHLRVGGAWRALPPGWPPWRTVYGRFRRWLALGLFEVLLREVARRRRRKVGRRPGPSFGIVDTQAVKCVAVRGPRGYDGAKGVVGRERVALVDAEGHRLAVAVVPASVQDREALDAGKARWPSLREGVYDGAFAAERCRAWSSRHGMRHRVVARDPAARGSVPLARRWVVERSFGWLSHWGGLAKDRGGRLDVSAARLAVVGILSGFEALLNPMPVRAAAQITSVAARICTSASTSGIAGFPHQPRKYGHPRILRERARVVRRMTVLNPECTPGGPLERAAAKALALGVPKNADGTSKLERSWRAW